MSQVQYDTHSETTLSRSSWPVLLRMRPEVVVTNVIVAVVMAWVGVVVIDILELGGPAAALPLWARLFNDGPVEWSQWFLLATTVLVSAYLSSRLHALGDTLRGAFFLLFAVGAALMLLEDAGDIRHVIGAYAIDGLGSDIVGLPINLFAEKTVRWGCSARKRHAWLPTTVCPSSRK